MNQVAKLKSVTTVMFGVQSIEKSVAFYRDLLGLPVKMLLAELALLDAGNLMVGLNHGLAKLGGPIAGATELVFSVPSVKASFQDLQEKGVEFIREPRQVTPTDWAATFLDPDGHKLSIFGPEN